MGYENIPHLKNDPTQQGQYRLKQNVVYSTATGEDLKLTLILPWLIREKRPLLVFVQGSAWTTPDFNHELPQLVLFARAGFAVATVGHRDRTKGHPFPAYLQDVKCAIRYLRSHAEEYGIDESRVSIWGTSSGGNTALLVGLTADEARYETEEYAGVSDRVNAVVSCFGPTDMIALSLHLLQKGKTRSGADSASGTSDLQTVIRIAKEMSPVHHVQRGKAYPPFLLLNGTGDEVVPHRQMELMYDKLIKCGADVQAYYVDGAEHEGNFWTEEVKQIILDFLKERT